MREASQDGALVKEEVKSNTLTSEETKMLGDLYKLDNQNEIDLDTPAPKVAPAREYLARLICNLLATLKMPEYRENDVIGWTHADKELKEGSFVLADSVLDGKGAFLLDKDTGIKISVELVSDVEVEEIKDGKHGEVVKEEASKL